MRRMSTEGRATGEPAVNGAEMDPKIIAVHGDEGVVVTGEQGDPGRDGVDGGRGQMGLVGASAPRRSTAVTVLVLIAILAGLGIVGEALWLVVDSARDESRLVADRDAERDANRALREEVAELRAENEVERETDACFYAYGAEIALSGQLTRALSTQMEAGIIYGLLTFAPDPPPEALLDATALLELADEAAAAAIADEKATEARNAWVTAGRPLPCPIEGPSGFRLGMRYMFAGRWDE